MKDHIDSLQRAVACGLADGKKSMVANLDVLAALFDSHDRLLRAAERVLAMPIAAYAPKMLEPSRSAFAELADAVAAIPRLTDGPAKEVGCPDCGPVTVTADVQDCGKPVSGLCPKCGDRLYFAPAPRPGVEGGGGG